MPDAAAKRLILVACILGTTVVTVGAPELWGTEYEVGE